MQITLICIYAFICKLDEKNSISFPLHLSLKFIKFNSSRPNWDNIYYKALLYYNLVINDTLINMLITIICIVLYMEII